MKKITLFYIFLFFVGSVPVYSQVQELNFKNATEKEMDLSAFEFKFYPLETTMDCLIGQPAEIRLFEDKWYISDYMLKKIFVFQKNGKHLFTIAALGQSGREYLNCSSFTINPYTKNIEIIDSYTTSIVKFDSKGQFVSKQKVPFYFDSFEYLTPKILVFDKSSLTRGAEGKYDLILTDNNYNVLKRLVATDKVPAGVTFSPVFPLKKYKNKITWIKAYDENIYEVSEIKSRVAAKMNFGNLWPEEDFIFNPKNKAYDLITNTFKNKGWLHYFDIYEMQKYFLATFYIKDTTPYLAIFNKKTGESVFYNCKKFPERINQIVGYGDDFVIFRINPKDLVKYDFPISKKQKAIIENMEEDENPWIVTMKKK